MITRYLHAPDFATSVVQDHEHFAQSWKAARRDFQSYSDLKLNEQCTLYFTVVNSGTAYFRMVTKLKAPKNFG